MPEHMAWRPLFTGRTSREEDRGYFEDSSTSYVLPVLPSLKRTPDGVYARTSLLSSSYMSRGQFDDAERRERIDLTGLRHALSVRVVPPQDR